MNAGGQRCGARKSAGSGSVSEGGSRTWLAAERDMGSEGVRQRVVRQSTVSSLYVRLSVSLSVSLSTGRKKLSASCDSGDSHLS